MANKFYLVSGSAGHSGSTVTPLLTMSTSYPAGGLKTSVTTTTTANNILCTNVAGVTSMAWSTPPVAGNFSLSGSVTMSLWGLESQANDNCGFAFQIWHKSGSASLNGNGVETSMCSLSWTNTEFGTTAANRTATASLTTRAFQTGDRVVLRLYANTGSFGSMTAGTITINYNGATAGASGEAFLEFSQNVPLKKKVAMRDR